MGPRTSLDGVGEKNNLLPLLDSNPGRYIKSFYLVYIYYCERGVELQVPIKAGIFFDKLSSHQLLKKHRAPCT